MQMKEKIDALNFSVDGPAAVLRVDPPPSSFQIQSINHYPSVSTVAHITHVAQNLISPAIFLFPSHTSIPFRRAQ